MVLLTGLFKVLAAWWLVAQLTVAHSTNVTKFPLLLDATVDELVDGLDSGAFSSVDLVNVSYSVFQYFGLLRS
jgi:hypothetical protein